MSRAQKTPKNHCQAGHTVDFVFRPSGQGFREGDRGAWCALDRHHIDKSGVNHAALEAVDAARNVR
jgi:hypothetical protein